MAREPNPNLARILFARRNVQPPTALYVSSDDYLTVTALFSDLAQDPPFILIRLLTPTGTVQHMQYRMTRSIASSGFELLRFPLREGQLLGVEVKAGAGGADRGDLFVVLELTRSLGPVNAEHAILAADYVSIFQPIGWPAGSVRSPAEGPGHDRMFALASPPAGQNISTVVPSLCRWQLKSIVAQLATSAVGGPRLVRIAIFDGTVVTYLCHSNVTQGAGTQVAYMFSQAQIAFGPIVGFVVQQVPMPPGVWIRRNWSVTLDVAAIQGGDQWGISSWWVEEALQG